MEPEEFARDLLERGYVEVESFGSLKVGTRVRHNGERYWQALDKGTGNVSRIFHKPGSAWEQSYGRPDVELIVDKDDGSHSYVADYHVAKVEMF